MHENLIFLSYRHSDAAPFARALKLELESELRAAQVFVDTDQIRGADRWAEAIEIALRAAKAVIPVIGRRWSGTDAAGIQDEDDWIRKELRIALHDKRGAVVPILVDGATPLRRSTLPPDLEELAEIQAIALDSHAWKAGVDDLLSTLEDRYKFGRKQDRWRFPKPDPLKANTMAIPLSELEDTVRKHLPLWSIEFSNDADRANHKRFELTRTFEFHSFPSAMGFMARVAGHAEEVQHHPRWMNIYDQVKVWLSTWDAGHRITPLDLEFARYLDRVYARMRVPPPANEAGRRVRGN